MNVVSAMEDPVLFAPDIHPETNRLLQMAVALRSRNRAQAGQLLWEARAADPACLPVYFALYKFYANAKRLADAERAVCLALAEAARQGGFPVSRRRLAEASGHYRLYDVGSGHFYLFSLKALAFLTLRQGRTDEASSILDDLQRLDPEDRVGGSVIRTLAESLRAEPDEAA